MFGSRAVAPHAFRDDRTREELLAENQRLREEILRRRSAGSMWPAIAGLLLHILLRPLLDPWLNAASDVKVAAAVVILAIPVLFAVATLVRALTQQSG